MGEMTKAEVVACLLLANAQRRDACVQYADAFMEYQEATANIDAHGLVVQHPRTLAPITNPYVAIRDRALKKLQRFPAIRAAALWE